MLELKLIHVSKRGYWGRKYFCTFTHFSQIKKSHQISLCWIKAITINTADLIRMQLNLSCPGLTHWGWSKMAAIFQTTFSNAFSWMKMYEFRLRFHWNFFPRVQITVFHHCFRQWLGVGQATGHYLKQWWLVDWRIYASLGLNELRTTGRALSWPKNSKFS